MSESGPVEAKADKSASAQHKAPIPLLTREGAFEPALEMLGRAPMSGLSGVLPNVDGAQRGRQVNRLQQTHGNAFVSRLLSPSTLTGKLSATTKIARVANGRTPTSSPELAEPKAAQEPEPSPDLEGLTLDATGAIQREPDPPASEESVAGALNAEAGHFDGDGRDHSDEELHTDGQLERGPTPDEMKAMDRTSRPPQFPYRADADTLNAGQVKWGKHEQFPRVLGQTYYAHNSIEVWPSYRLKYGRKLLGDVTAKPETTDAAGGVWDALATPENEKGYKMPDEHPKHPGHEFYIRESGAAANIIAAAEQQHINDLDTGWAITGLAARDAINAAAGEDPSVGDDQAAAKKAAIDNVVGKMGALGPKLRANLESGGRLETGLGPMMDKSYVQSEAQRDKTGKHTLNMRYVTKDSQSKKVLYEIVDDKPLDATPSATVVNLGTVS